MSKMTDREKTNILLVDDVPDKLLVYQAVLEELDENLIAVRSGEEALKEVLKDDFAVILLDVNMPGMDGFETAQLIRQRRRSAHTPLIFLTAFTDEVRISKGYAMGAVDYISTPVVPQILRAKVRVFTDLFRLRRQVAQQAEERARREAAEEAARRSTFLAETSRGLANSLDFSATFKRLASLGVPYLADVCAVCLVDDRGLPREAAISWLDSPTQQGHFHRCEFAELAPWLRELMERVLESGKQETETLVRLAPVLRHPLADQSAAEKNASGNPPDVHSVMALPLSARGRSLGAIAWGVTTAGRTAPTAAVALVDELAGRGSIALDNALLVRDIQENDRRKNEFLAMLAHELRNPLAPIRNAHEILRRLHSQQPELVLAREVIDRQLTHLVRLVDDLLDVSRITRGKIRLQSRLLEISEVVRSAVETSRPLVEAQGQHLEVKQAGRPLYVFGDSARLVQVFGNLLNNASKFTPRGGRISLVVEAPGSEVVVRVRDDGTGIPREMLSQIFDLFTQVNHALDRTTGGLGVGLTLVQRIVELHHGTVQALSEGLTKGSEFVVRLPLQDVNQPPAGEPAAIESPPPAREGRRVLLVDDNVDASRTLSLLLLSDQHEVELAHCGEDALQAAQTFRPDVILLDIGMPGMDGFEVARRLRASEGTRDVLLIALTGYGQNHDRERAREVGFDHFLVKPMKPEALQKILG
jgi:CheY-like chemotaxis protein